MGCTRRPLPPAARTGAQGEARSVGLRGLPWLTAGDPLCRASVRGAFPCHFPISLHHSRLWGSTEASPDIALFLHCEFRPFLFCFVFCRFVFCILVVVVLTVRWSLLFCLKMKENSLLVWRLPSLIPWGFACSFLCGLICSRLTQSSFPSCICRFSLVFWAFIPGT